MKRYFISRDVAFYETKFPFASLMTGPGSDNDKETLAKEFGDDDEVDVRGGLDPVQDRGVETEKMVNRKSNSTNMLARK